MSVVGKAIKGATSFLVGGNKSAVQGSNFGEMSADEQQRLTDIESEIDRMFGEQGSLSKSNLAESQDIQSLFVNNLKSFLTNGGQQTPEQLKEASDFVDQTFTNPTQQVVNQNISDYQSQAQARAAALGRNPNADIATQQAIAGEGLRQNIGLQAERGARIQQASQDQYNRGIGSLNAGMSGSGFLNGLTQQAFQNQLGLLNGRSGLADFYQKERSKTNLGTQTSSGLLTNLNSIQNGVGNVVAGGSNNYNMISGLVGGGGSSGGAAGGIGAMFSDARLKVNVELASEDLSECLANITPYSFEYGNQEHGKGVTYGVMAQDLEKSKAGRTIVFDTKEGKKIDLTKAVSMLLANQALLLKRINELESRG